MKRFAAGIAAVALAGCATTADNSARITPAWLVGTWLMLDPQLNFPLACSSGLPIRYNAGGEYVLFEESGSWWLNGDRLTETALVGNDFADPAEVQIGRPYVSRIKRAGRDKFRKVYSDGRAETFRRCPDR